jgi:hypothetical protein
MRSAVPYHILQSGLLRQENTPASWYRLLLINIRVESRESAAKSNSRFIVKLVQKLRTPA